MTPENTHGETKVATMQGYRCAYQSFGINGSCVKCEVRDRFGDFARFRKALSWYGGSRGGLPMRKYQVLHAIEPNFVDLGPV